MKHLTLRNILQKKMRNPEFRFYFRESKAVSELCMAVAHARQTRGLTQASLAKSCRTTQSVIARLENGNNGRMPSLDLLNRIASALDLNLVIGFEEQEAA